MAVSLQGTRPGLGVVGEIGAARRGGGLPHEYACG